MVLPNEDDGSLWLLGPMARRHAPLDLDDVELYALHRTDGRDSLRHKLLRLLREALARAAQDKQVTLVDGEVPRDAVGAIPILVDDAVHPLPLRVVDHVMKLPQELRCLLGVTHPLKPANKGTSVSLWNDSGLKEGGHSTERGKGEGGDSYFSSSMATTLPFTMSHPPHFWFNAL